MSAQKKPTTYLCKHYQDAIYYRDKNLVEDLLGSSGFMAVASRQILGRDLPAEHLAMVEAVMIAVMEHGFTPSAIAARSIYMSSPENMQAGVAAGLLGVASQFVGTMENCGAYLVGLAKLSPMEQEAAGRELIAGHRAQRRPLAGFGHHLHSPDDPRAMRLLEMSRERGVAGPHQEALLRLSPLVDEAYGRHLTINATGSAAAIFADVGIPVAVMRGFAIIARAAGLVAHMAEEQREPTGRYIWDLVDHDIPFAEDLK
ncbi:citryl-CoA lyase [Roseomonas sp. GC11]|uniref:citryl-CoA lyase n=1 Tax=Roseomonas sp. GC11 TaxID=2950546 RepID=UPI00210D1765|nr:citryl-CoA lyase [Roseomonas sp. GC11]MCQ4160538.1 citryl-CoA lyase [Roseomonas sp. GC11]